MFCEKNPYVAERYPGAVPASVTTDEPSLAAPPENENLVRTVWSLAWPAVALNSLGVINNLLDSAFIGHLPRPALVAYGGITNIQFLLFSLAMAVSTAATALVSRAYGAGEPFQVRKGCHQSLTVAILGGIVFGVLGWLSAPATAHGFLPAVETEAIRLMIGFLTIYATSLPAIYTIQALAGCLRGVGDTKSPMVISGIQILLHILLNFALIMPSRPTPWGFDLPGAGMGLLGGATALSISAWCSAIGYMLYTGKTPLGSVLRLHWPEWAWTRRILRIAVPAALMAVLRVASLAVFTLVLKHSKDAGNALAAMRPGFAIESIMFMPAFGLSMAAAALVGQSLGMRRPDRAERVGWIASNHAALVTVLLGIPIFVFAPEISNLMIVGKPLIVEQAIVLLRYLAVTEIGFAYGMTMIGAMQGAGDTKRPLWISVISLWILRVPLAIVLTLSAGQWIREGALSFVLPVGLGLGAGGAWIAMSLTQFVQGVLSIIAFRQGGWKTKTV